MTTTANIGYGSKVEVSTDSGATYTAIAQVSDIKGPKGKVKSVQSSNNDSPSAAHEFVPGMYDGGEATITIVHKAATVTQLMALRRIFCRWRITYPAGSPSTWVFDGFWTDLEATDPLDDVQMDDLTVKVSGLPVFTA